MATKPTHEQGELQLKIFDLRREARLRQARDWFTQNFHPNSFDDAMRIAPMATIQEARQRFSNPLFLAHLEKAANRYETWVEERAPGLIAAMRQMMKQMAAQASKAA